jgi:DNA-directed RNA polymerase specialized sigma24 family protein
MKLPVKYRVALLLRDLEELSTEEAAAALGLSIPGLKARVARTLDAAGVNGSIFLSRQRG